MPKLNTTVKSVRIDNDKLAELEDRLGGKTINAWLNEQIECYLFGEKGDKGVNPQKKSEKTELSLNKWGIDEKILEDMATMIPFMGESVAEMIRLMDAALNEGMITYENGRYIGTPEIYLDDLKEACHERGIGMQEAIDKTVKNLRSGK